MLSGSGNSGCEELNNQLAVVVGFELTYVYFGAVWCPLMGADTGVKRFKAEKMGGRRVSFPDTRVHSKNQGTLFLLPGEKRKKATEGYVHPARIPVQQ